MRITVDITTGEAGELVLRVTVPHLPLAPEALLACDDQFLQPVVWLRDDLLVAADAVVDEPNKPDKLAHAAECHDTDRPEEQHEQLDLLREYGRLLFEAAFKGIWQLILDTVPKDPADYLEVAVLGSADGERRALQALRWEALHDGERFIVAQGAADDADRSVQVGVVRIITPLASWPAGVGQGHVAAEGACLQKVARIPRVLFAAGSHLTDGDIRSGAEFMGIMRRLDRSGGFVQAHVLERATRQKLVDELAAFQPDVVHFIGHGRRLADGQVRVELQSDSGGKDHVSAEELLAAFGAAGHSPLMMVLSACQAGMPGEGRMSGLSFAARLVAGNGVSRGVPVVVAMAGDISDTACRVFAQAMTTAIGTGVPLGKAVIRGRRAAFYNGPGPDAQHPAPDSCHWVMPVLFLADYVRDDASLTQADLATAVRERARHLMLTDREQTVFYGRTEFLTKVDQLLNEGGPKVLVAHTPDDGSYGGLRLLQEVGIRALHAGVLPVLLGPYDQGAPQSLAELATHFELRINLLGANLFGLRPRHSSAVAAVKDGTALDLARAMREDLDAVVAAMPANDPVHRRLAGQAQAMLLCHRVTGWGEAVRPLLRELLGSVGLNGEPRPVPVVLTGADAGVMKEALEGGWLKAFINMELRRFEKDQDEDMLACQWWLLNPPEALGDERLAFAPRPRASDSWKKVMRRVLKNAARVYDKDIYNFAEDLSPDYLVSASDDYLLASYARVLT